MKEKLKEIEKAFDAETVSLTEESKLEQIRVAYLGKKGKVSEAFSWLRDVAPESKREMGQLVNALREKVESKIGEFRARLDEENVLREISSGEKIDITLPIEVGCGSLHPRTIVQKEIEDVFVSMGFSIECGDEIQTEYANFDSVNTPASHPARDAQDTFWLDNGQLLRTQTTSLQNQVIRKYKGPFRAIFPGRVFRNEALDASHENTFFQLEGVVVDKNISVANLTYFMKDMLEKVFKKEVKIRLRPGFFPFTEPSFELDIFCPFCEGKGCPVCKGKQWIELCPCGMIHPNVLREGGVDPEVYNGFAFGLGFDRLAMIRGKINDIRYLNSGNVRLFRKFGLNL